MNKFVAVAAFAAMFSAPAFAGSLTSEGDPQIEELSSGFAVSVAGSVEYNIETESLDVEVGPTVSVWLVDITPTVSASYTNSDLTFNGVDVEVLYPVAYGLDAYVTVSTDNDFNYNDATVGIAFKF